VENIFIAPRTYEFSNVTVVLDLVPDILCHLGSDPT